MPSLPKAPDMTTSPPGRGAGFQLFLFLPKALYEALCERAADDDTTLAGVMRQALRAWLRTGGDIS